MFSMQCDSPLIALRVVSVPMPLAFQQGWSEAIANFLADAAIGTEVEAVIGSAVAGYSVGLADSLEAEPKTLMSGFFLRTVIG